MLISVLSYGIKCLLLTMVRAGAAWWQGRQFPVEVFYTPAPEPSYVDAALAAIWQLHSQEGPGDVLVFLTGQEEIEAVQQLLKPARCALWPGTLQVLEFAWPHLLPASHSL